MRRNPILANLPCADGWHADAPPPHRIPHVGFSGDLRLGGAHAHHLDAADGGHDALCQLEMVAGQSGASHEGIWRGRRQSRPLAKRHMHSSNACLEAHRPIVFCAQEMKASPLYFWNGMMLFLVWILARLLSFPPFFYVVYIQRDQIKLLSTYHQSLREWGRVAHALQLSPPMCRSPCSVRVPRFAHHPQRHVVQQAAARSHQASQPAAEEA